MRHQGIRKGPRCPLPRCVEQLLPPGKVSASTGGQTLKASFRSVNCHGDSPSLQACSSRSQALASSPASLAASPCVHDVKNVSTTALARKGWRGWLPAERKDCAGDAGAHTLSACTQLPLSSAPRPPWAVQGVLPGTTRAPGWAGGACGAEAISNKPSGGKRARVLSVWQSPWAAFPPQSAS